MAKATKSCMRCTSNIYTCEFIKDGLYFLPLWTKKEPLSNDHTYFFSIDNELVYMNYYSDFGPLNLGMLYRYCMKVNILRKHFFPEGIKLVHYTAKNPKKRTNAAFLIGSYAIIYLEMTPKQAHDILLRDKSVRFLEFRDASMNVASCYTISLMDCFEGLYRALQCGFFNFADFNLEEYETFEMIQFGDLNWVIPQKFIAFCGPSATGKVYKKPEFYIKYFKRNDVAAVVRLNEAAYNAESFRKVGIDHYELFFVDGGVPPHDVLQNFLAISEKTKGAIAVHCKAGLGRTGSLIGAYLMKHYRMKAKEAIAWLRICRPGSVICHQQRWLEEMQHWLWKCGDYYRMKNYGNLDYIIHHKYGIYSIKAKMHIKEEEQKITIKSRKTSPDNSTNKSSHTKKQHYVSHLEKQENIANSKKQPTENKKLSTTLTPLGRMVDYNKFKNFNYGPKTCAWQTSVKAALASQQSDPKKLGSYYAPNRKQFTQGDYLRAIKMQQSEAPPLTSRDMHVNHNHKLAATKIPKEVSR